MNNPGSPLSGAERGLGHRDVRPPDRQRPLPVGADRHQHVDRPLHRDDGALHLRLGHDRRPDGYYDLRAIALDSSGYTRTSATIANRRVENTAPTVDDGRPGHAADRDREPRRDRRRHRHRDRERHLRVPAERLLGRLDDDLHRPQHRLRLPWNTAAVADGLYDLRATALDVAGNSASSTFTARRLDNTAPSVAISDDGSPQARHGDAQLDDRRRQRQRRRVGPLPVQADRHGPWADACVGTVGPAFSCARRHQRSAGRHLRGPRDRHRRRRLHHHVGHLRHAHRQHGAGHGDDGRPGAATLQGAATLAGTGTDAGSGMASMRFEYKPTPAPPG